MSDVKWIKLKVGMFDGESFKKIKRAKIGGEKFRDKLTAVWFELMDFAGKCNHAGAFINSREIPFDNLDDIAIMIDRETEELELCMRFFINEGMVEIIDNVYMLSNWAQYQNEDKLEKMREQKRLRQARWRANKALQEGVDAKTSTEASTVDASEGLPSYSYSYSNNSSKDKKGEYEGEEKEPKDPAPPPDPPKPVAHKRGQYGWVRLTDDQYARLISEFGQQRADRAIAYVDESAQGTGNKNKWKDWNIVVRKCIREGWGQNRQNYGSPPPQRQSTGFQTSNPFMEMLEEERGRK